MITAATNQLQVVVSNQEGDLLGANYFFASALKNDEGEYRKETDISKKQEFEDICQPF